MKQSMDMKRYQIDFDYRWFKNGKHILTSPGSKDKLTILNARLEDQGVYQCFSNWTDTGENLQGLYASSTIIFES